MRNLSIYNIVTALLMLAVSVPHPALACGKGYPRILAAAVNRYSATQGAYLEAFQIAYRDWSANVSRGKFSLRICLSSALSVPATSPRLQSR